MLFKKAISATTFSLFIALVQINCSSNVDYSESDRASNQSQEVDKPLSLGYSFAQTDGDAIEKTVSVTNGSTYAPDSTVTYTVNQPGASAMALYFSRLNTEKNYDFIILKNKKQQEIARYHGEKDPFWTPVINGDTVYITLISDGSNQKSGFAVSKIRHEGGDKQATWSDETAKTSESAHPYTNNFDQTYTITQSGASQVAVHFEYLKTEANIDKVFIMDGSNKVIAEYSGEKTDFWAEPVSGDTVKIRLVTDWSVTKDGFKVDKIKYATGGSSDTFTYSGISHHSPHNYSNNQTISQTITASGASKIKIHFSRFETESGKDIVTIKDGSDTTIETFSGNLGDFWTSTVTGDTIKVELQTDASVTGWGFHIDQAAHVGGSAPGGKTYDRYIFDEIVAIGDSLCHSFQSGSVEETRQPYSYCNVFARQAGDELNNPLLKYPGYLVQGEDVFKGDCGVFCVAKALIPSRRNADNSNITNFAITGADSITVYYSNGECADSRYRERKWSWLKFRYVDGCKDDAGKYEELTLLTAESQVQQAVKKNPSFVSAWFTNNDTLSVALHTDPEAMTEFNIFKEQVDKVLAEFTAIDARGVTASTPNVTAIRYMVDSGVTDGSKLDGLKAFYNPTVDKADEVLDSDELSYILAELNRKNQYLEDKAAAIDWTFVDAYASFNDIHTNGRNLIDSNGNTTGTYVGAHWPGDSHDPRPADKGRYGLFSLDGVHPNNTGHCIAGNFFIEAVNTKYGQSIPYCDEYSTLQNNDSLNASPVDIPGFLESNLLGQVISALIDVFL